MSQVKFNSIGDKTVEVAKDVLIRPFAVIGFLPFEYESRKDKGFKVILKKGVRVGSCTSIDRGIDRHTIIEDMSIIGNGCHIGHGTHIGKDCYIGDGAVIMPNLDIPNDTLIHANTVISNDVTLK